MKKCSQPRVWEMDLNSLLPKASRGAAPELFGTSAVAYDGRLEEQAQVGSLPIPGT